MNPYIAGAPIDTPEMFFGRETLITTIIQGLFHNHIALEGPRRSGKSSLLIHLAHRLAASDHPHIRFIPVRIDCQRITEDQFFALLMRALIKAVTAMYPSLVFPPCCERPPQPPYDDLDFEEDLTTLLTALRQHEPRDVRCVILIDEGDALNHYHVGMRGKIRAILSDNKVLKLVWAGVSILKESRSEDSPWYNMLLSYPLLPLTADDARLLITEPARTAGYQYDTDTTIQRILTCSEGQPYLIQSICFRALATAQAEQRCCISAPDVEAAIAELALPWSSTQTTTPNPGPAAHSPEDAPATGPAASGNNTRSWMTVFGSFWTVAILGILAIVIIAGIVRVTTSRQPQEQTQPALDDPQDRLVHAYEQARDQRTPATESALHDAIQTFPWQVVVYSHTAAVNQAVFHPDGHAFATASNDGTIQVWSIDGEQILQIAPGDFVNDVVFSPDGRLLASANSDKVARIWDASTGEQLQELRGHAGSIASLEFTPDGQMIITASGFDDRAARHTDYTARLWDISTGTEQRTFRGHEGYIQDVAVSPDGNWMVTASMDSTARTWDIATGRARISLNDPQPGAGHQAAINTVAISTDREQTAIATGGDIGCLWQTPTLDRCVLLFNVSEQDIFAVAFSPTEPLVATGGTDHTVRLWDRRTGELQRELPGHTNRINAVAFSPNGTLLLTASRDKTVRLWNVRPDEELPGLYGHNGRVNHLAVSPDGAFIVSAGDDRTIRLWDSTTGTEEEDPIREDIIGKVRHAAWSPDGRWIATASGKQIAHVWNSQTRDQHWSFGHPDVVTSVVWSPDGTVLITTSHDNHARLWSMSTGKPIAELPETTNLTSAVVSPDGNRLITGHEDGSVTIWSMTTHTRIHEWSLHSQRITSLAFSPDGKRLLSASDDQTAQVWNVQTGALLLGLVGHTSQVNSAVFSPDGTRILTASSDKTTRMWDAQTGDIIVTLRRPAFEVSSAIFSHDGRFLLTAHHDGSIHRYYSRFEDLLDLAQQRLAQTTPPPQVP